MLDPTILHKWLEFLIINCVITSVPTSFPSCYISRSCFTLLVKKKMDLMPPIYKQGILQLLFKRRRELKTNI
jgi:hypothetical protein